MDKPSGDGLMDGGDGWSGMRMSQLLDLSGFVNAFDSQQQQQTSTFASFQQQLSQTNGGLPLNMSFAGMGGNQQQQQQPQQTYLQQMQSSLNQLKLFQQQQPNNNNNNNLNNINPMNNNNNLNNNTLNQLQYNQTQIQNNQFNQQQNGVIQQQHHQQQQPQHQQQGGLSLLGSTDIQTELRELYSSLQTLSQESVQHLFFLTRSLQPQLSEDARLPLISKMFSDVPKVIDLINSQDQYLAYYSDASNHAFHLFMDFKELSNMLGRISYLQLFTLTNNLVAPGSPQAQFALLLRVQEYFARSSTDMLRLLNTAVSTGNSGVLVNQRLLQIDQSISVDIVHFVSGIMSLQLTELLSFHAWFSVLTKKMLAVLLAMLQLESSTVLDLKRILSSTYLPPLPNIQISDHHHHHQHQQQTHNNNNNNNNNNLVPTMVITNSPNGIGQSHNGSNQQQQQQQNGQTLISSDFSSLQLPPLFPTLNLSTSGFSETKPMVLVSTPTNTSPSLTSTSNTSNTTTPTTTGNNSQLIVKNELLLSPNSPSSVLNTSASSILASQSQSDDCSFYLKIARQPPNSTVYQRILKPFPSVMLCGPGVENANLSNFFVEATLLRNDNHNELTTCLDGNKISRISNGTFAPFKKLKILSTTQQQRTLFRLKFVLKRYIGSDFQTISKASVLSDPIEVFSHTIYLTDKQDVPLPPTVTEVVPSQGPPNTRMVVLGSNFVKGDSLSVSFGPMNTVGQFYEKGTIICNAPERDQTVKSGQSVFVNVSNDGEQFSSDQIAFTYTR